MPLTETQIIVAKTLSDGREYTVQDLVRKTKSSDSSVRSALYKLIHYGLAEESRVDKIKVYRSAIRKSNDRATWELTPAGKAEAEQIIRAEAIARSA